MMPCPCMTDRRRRIQERKRARENQSIRCSSRYSFSETWAGAGHDDIFVDDECERLAGGSGDDANFRLCRAGRHSEQSE